MDVCNQRASSIRVSSSRTLLPRKNYLQFPRAHDRPTTASECLRSFQGLLAFLFFAAYSSTHTANPPFLSLHTALYSRRVVQHLIYWVSHAFSKSRASMPRCPLSTAVFTPANRFSFQNDRRAPTANGRTKSNTSTKSFPVVLRTLLVK